MAFPADQADYVVVGGGLTGCVVASRLSQASKVVLLEAGIDASDDPNTKTIQGAFALTGSGLDWAYKTLPDPNTAGRTHTVVSGKVLGGSSMLNYGSWLRADAADYDDWALAANDQRWNYKNQLPYLKKVEDFFDSANPDHGVDGPLHVTSVSADEHRVYGLREPLVGAWGELGVKYSAQGSGSSYGISEMLENFRNGQRQPASQAWDLRGVKVITGAKAQRIVLGDGDLQAKEVELTDGRRFPAKKEIILAAGAYGTAQLLMLSGIGSKDVLDAHGITTHVVAPDVGQNLIDHFSLVQYWKLKNPEQGLAMGNPLWTHPSYANGLPADWIINEAVPSDLLQRALEADRVQGAPTQEASSLLAPSRCHLETMTMYAAFGSPAPPDGSIISTAITLMLPTSRGSVSITSASALDPPQIKPNFYSTKADQTALLYGARRLMQVFLTTKAGREHIASEGGFPGMSPLDLNSSDADIDDRIRKTGMAQAHSVGTAAMGKVVDSRLCVKGVQNLRIVDASVLPVSIGGHPQASLYALAEQAADLILGY